MSTYKKPYRFHVSGFGHRLEIWCEHALLKRIVWNTFAEEKAWVINNGYEPYKDFVPICACRFTYTIEEEKFWKALVALGGFDVLRIHLEKQYI